MRIWLPALFLAVLQDPVEVVGERFRVVSTYRDRSYAESIARGLEGGYPEFAKLMNLEPREPGPYTVRLYGTRDEYIAKDKEMNEGRFARNGAFSHPRTQEAYILIQPRPDVPLFERTETVIYHEAFHLFYYRQAAWLRRAPAWLYEGMAELAADHCMRRLSTVAAPKGLKLRHSLTLVQRLAGTKDAVALADLLSKDQSSNADFVVRWGFYAGSMLLVKYLTEERPEAWKKFLELQRELPEREAGADRTRELLLQATGGTLEALEAEWLKWVKSREGVAWLILDGDWKLTSDGVEGAAFPGDSAFLVTAEPVEAARFTVRAEVKIEATGSGQADLVFVDARDLRARNLWKASVVRNGSAAILVRKDGVWRSAAFRKIDPAKIPAGWFAIEVEVDGRTVTLRADGRPLIEHFFEAGEAELSKVFWGLGCYDGWCRFRGFKLIK